MQNQSQLTNSELIATYSLEDNKLRLYSNEKLDRETYDLVYENGFRYAPAQKLFVAPKWTPTRARVLRDLCGEIQDEKMTLAERSDARAARFTQYAENRRKDSNDAYSKASAISGMIPPGQPILVDHYSAKRHRRDIERIDDSMRKSIKMDKLSEYWKDRAEEAEVNGAEDSPETRLNRIKKLSKEKRNSQKLLEKY